MSKTASEAPKASAGDVGLVPSASARDLVAENARLARELAEALEYQAATTEVLGIIAGSPGALEPVFAAMLESAVRICGAKFGNLWLREGDIFRIAATHGAPPTYRQYFEREPVVEPDPNSGLGQIVRTKQPIQIEDVASAPTYNDKMRVATIELAKARSLVAVPMLRDDEVVGAIAIYRQEVRPFTDKQVDLLANFAKQAVIAIENTRLLNELRAKNADLTEALQQQTATSEILRVISNSPTDAQPVFSAIARNAVRLCGAMFGAVFSFDGSLVHFVAGHQVTEDALRLWRGEYPISPRGLIRLAITDRAVVNVADMFNDPRVANVEVARMLGNRSQLVVPMLQAGQAIGTINVYGAEPAPFSEAQVSLLQTFADQAVIAIENTRLFEAEQARTRELSEALEQQTATAEVLGAISRSKFELQPVLDTLVASAAHLCDASMVAIHVQGDASLRGRARHGFSADMVEAIGKIGQVMGRGSLGGRVLIEGRPVHIPDVEADAEYAFRDFTRITGARSMLGVPLLRDGKPVGLLSLYRTRVAPFSPRQIELIETFADQAVIAIENTRLFEEVQTRTRELTESLEYQTATSEVLNVISRSKFDLQPVLDTIVETAARLCIADMANIWRREGDAYVHLASYGMQPDLAEFMRSSKITSDRGSIVGRVLLEGRYVQIPDVLADPEFTLAELQRRGNFRTVLGVPLLREGVQVGIIVLLRHIVRPFTEKQIELVTTFADQAVIAIENTRLFEQVQERTRELESALERQTATSEILSVISSSPGTLEPVFDAILERARKLCDAHFGHLLLYDGEVWRPAALQNVPSAYAEFWRRAPLVPAPNTLLAILPSTGRPYQLEDARLGAAYLARSPLAVATVELGRARTLMGVPLLKDGKVVGAIVLYRAEVRAFHEQQIALLSSFASQAVIAIENARLLADLQERQRELARSVEQLQSLGEVSKTVNSSLDLAKVLPSILEHACAMSYATGGTVYAFDKESGEFHLAAGHNMSEEHTARVRAQPIQLGDSVVGECAERREAVQIADLETAQPTPLLDILRRAGVRATLSVPLLHQDEVIGALVVRRNHPGAFSPEIIRLLEAFAAQSAVAVHNAHLFEEVEQKGRQLAIASQHKSQFVANMSHELRTPLAAILGYAELLKEGIYGALPDKSTPIVGRIQSNGTHLLGLINTVLDLSKIEAGQFSLSMSEYSLDSMVENVRVATESLAQAKDLAFKTDVAGNLPFGLGDEQRLTQVLLNLVGNAIKFTDAGEVRIAAGLKAGRFAVAVTDTGPGIPAEEQHKIFEEFHQVDNSNTKKKGGTGLGLAIAKQIVEMHGGRIWVESSPGKGSTFRMELPVRAASAKGAT